MDTPETSAIENEPEGDRANAEMFYGLALRAFSQIGYDEMPAAEMSARTPIEQLADAQLLALQAIYHELRHGHNQVAAQTATLPSTRKR